MKTVEKGVKKQLWIKTWILASVVFGFCVAVLIPRFAIQKLGSEIYGFYALVLGYVPILAMADFGMLPGITRRFASCVAMNDNIGARSLLSRANRIIIFSSSLACIVVIFLLIIFTDERSLDVILAIILLAIVSFLSIRFDIRLAFIRATGKIELSYAFRIGYLTIYLLFFFIAYFCIEAWSGISVILLSQMTAILFVELVLAKVVRRILLFEVRSHKNNEVDPKSEREIWKDIWRASSTELSNRGVQFFVAAIERPLILAYSGILMVGSIDLVGRLMLIVSAIPGALNQPLLAMLSHDAARKHADAKFPHALRLTKIVSIGSAGLGFCIAMILFAFFHENIFGVSTIVPMYLAFLMALASGVNVLTASGAAVLLSKGIIWPANTKSLIEFVGVFAGLIISIAKSDGLYFLTCRYGFLFLSAIYFLFVENILKNTSNGRCS